MLPLQKLSERWKREEEERREKARVFDVIIEPQRLVLIKRFEALKSDVLIALSVSVGWPLLNWFIYQSPVNRDTWIGWFLLWCCFGPLIVSPILIQAWRAWRGECWIFDRSSGTLILNGQEKTKLSEIKCVRVWQETGAESSKTLLALYSKRGRKILLVSSAWSASFHWDELLNVATQISEVAQIPLKSKSDLIND